MAQRHRTHAGSHGDEESPLQHSTSGVHPSISRCSWDMDISGLGVALRLGLGEQSSPLQGTEQQWQSQGTRSLSG